MQFKPVFHYHSNQQSISISTGIQTDISTGVFQQVFGLAFGLGELTDLTNRMI
jgi:hypothetical protein